MKGKRNKVEVKEITYPCLMRNGDSNVLIMIRPKVGVWVTGDRVGEMDTGLIMSVIKPYNGSVTIENDEEDTQ